MSRRPRPLPAELGTSFTVTAALAAGIAPARLRASDLETPFRGARTAITGPPPADDEPFARDRAERERVLTLARACAGVIPADGCFVGRTAAVLLPARVRAGIDLDVGVFPGTRAPRRAGVRAVTVRPALASIRVVDRLRVTSPASTWAMLGRELPVRELVVMGDAIVRTPRDRAGRLRPGARLATLDQLRAAASAGRRRGAARLREALGLIRDGSDSPPETEYRLDAAAACLPHPHLDVEIRNSAGRLLGISEFLYPEQRVIEKYRAYAAIGIEVARITAGHRRAGGHIEIVREALIRRGWDPETP